jgi:hypothetical protein
MEQNLIFLPVFSLVALTFGMGIWLIKLRFSAVKCGDLNPRYFEFNRGVKLPDHLIKVSHNYDNLLALPVLFYVITLMLFVTNKVDLAQIILAWIFVFSRYVHSYIHTTSNNVKHRMFAFMFGVATLIGMWSLYFMQFVVS